MSTFAVTIRRRFVAAHAIRLPDGALEPIHEHDFDVRATVAAWELDAIDTVMDFHELQHLLDHILQPLKNQNLNQIAPFATSEGGKLSPTAERIAQWLADELITALDALPHLRGRVRLTQLTLEEAPDCIATYIP
jgi:6-pyruvoyltetrahydropterin/6-carboxytetrahydropterin synthase